MHNDPKPLLLFADDTRKDLEDQVAKHFATNPADAGNYKYGEHNYGISPDGEYWYTVTFYHRSFS